ncbi:hypothetical protein BASA62_009509 [Batrachochytrium salamandrivorans]|nr:hypothetical protein BASA62_009509 [Batrachochytrium salamandrivorans]
MKVAAATFFSLVVTSAYASPAAHSANQEVNTQGSSIESPANVYLEKRGGGLHGYAQGVRGADNPPLNNQDYESHVIGGRWRHSRRYFAPSPYAPDNEQYQNPHRELGPYETLRQAQQQNQRNQGTSSPYASNQERYQNPHKKLWYVWNAPTDTTAKVKGTQAQQQNQENQGTSSPHEANRNAQLVGKVKSEDKVESEEEKEELEQLIDPSLYDFRGDRIVYPAYRLNEKRPDLVMPSNNLLERQGRTQYSDKERDDFWLINQYEKAPSKKPMHGYGFYQDQTKRYQSYMKTYQGKKEHGEYIRRLETERGPYKFVQGVEDRIAIAAGMHEELQPAPEIVDNSPSQQLKSILRKDKPCLKYPCKVKFNTNAEISDDVSKVTVSVDDVHKALHSESQSTEHEDNEQGSDFDPPERDVTAEREYSSAPQE